MLRSEGSVFISPLRLQSPTSKTQRDLHEVTSESIALPETELKTPGFQVPPTERERLVTNPRRSGNEQENHSVQSGCVHR